MLLAIDYYGNLLGCNAWDNEDELHNYMLDLGQDRLNYLVHKVKSEII